MNDMCGDDKTSYFFPFSKVSAWIWTYVLRFRNEISPLYCYPFSVNDC